MKKSVEILGGFKGNETVFTHRNFETHKTILSGDFFRETNAYSVFYHLFNPSNILDETALLNGVTITDGRANIS